MKKYFCVAFLSLISLAVWAQTITIHSINVSNQNNYRNFSVSMSVETDVEGFTGNIDPAKSTISVLKDANGIDLIEKQRKYEEEMKAENKYVNPLQLTCNGIAYEYTGFELYLQSSALPSKGAGSVTLEGNIAMVMEGDKESKAKIKSLPLDGSEIDSKLGKVSVIESGEITLNDGTVYRTFMLQTSVPVISMEVKGEDTQFAKEKLGVGVNSNEFVFKTPPESCGCGT